MCCKLSIIVPVYKVEPYIQVCINSILAQTFKDFELIIVGDASPDMCGQVCDEYARKDNRIKVIHKVNGGLSSARNAGIEIAQGEYIGFVDGDDYIDKDMYQTLYNLTKKYDADVAECGFFKVRGKDIENVIHKEGIMSGDNLFALGLLAEYGLHSIVCNKIYKRQLFTNIRFPPGKIHEDEFIMHRIFFELKRYVYIGVGKYFYVQRTGSIMDEEYSLKKMDRLEAYEDRFMFYKKNVANKVNLNLVEQRYFNDILYNYYCLNEADRLDPCKVYRKKLRKRILKNYTGFMNNSLLAKYRSLIMSTKLNQFLFDIVYFLYQNQPGWYCSIKSKLTTYMKHKLRWVSL